MEIPVPVKMPDAVFRAASLTRRQVLAGLVLIWTNLSHHDRMYSIWPQEAASSAYHICLIASSDSELISGKSANAYIS